MTPEDAALVANMRAEVAAGAFLVTVGGKVAIFPDQIVGRTDDELLAFIADRLEQ